MVSCTSTRTLNGASTKLPEENRRLQWSLVSGAKHFIPRLGRVFDRPCRTEKARRISGPSLQSPPTAVADGVVCSFSFLEWEELVSVRIGIETVVKLLKR